MCWRVCCWLAAIWVKAVGQHIHHAARAVQRGGGVGGADKAAVHALGQGGKRGADIDNALANSANGLRKKWVLLHLALQAVAGLLLLGQSGLRGLQLALQLAVFAFDLAQPGLADRRFLTSKHDNSTALARHLTRCAQGRRCQIRPARDNKMTVQFILT